MRYSIILATLLQTHFVWANGVDCSKTKENASLIEKEICKDTKLKALDRELVVLFESVKKQLPGEQRDLLEQTQRFFFIGRNDCQNQDSSHGEFGILVKNCLEKKYTVRRDVLKELKGRDPFPSLTKDLEFFDLPFVKQYGSKLLGRKLKVAGTLSLDAQTQNSQQRNRGAIKDKKDVLPVVFKSMPESEAAFLDDNNPFGHHEATVDEENGQVVLRISSLLGRNLP